MRVTMVGSGYVGLVSGACFADFGHQVVCVDKDNARIETLKRGKTPIYRPGLGDLVANNLTAGRDLYRGTAFYTDRILIDYRPSNWVHRILGRFTDQGIK